MINFLPGVSSTASALNSERARMDVISQNIANVNNARGVAGKPYQRQQVVFQTVLDSQLSQSSPGSGAAGVEVARIERDLRPPRMVYNPGHPDADPKSGMVSFPDINIHEEMADLIVSSRSYEANLAVFKNARFKLFP